jgi:hypothetical protein
MFESEETPLELFYKCTHTLTVSNIGWHAHEPIVYQLGPGQGQLLLHPLHQVSPLHQVIHVVDHSPLGSELKQQQVVAIYVPILCQHMGYHLLRIHVPSSWEKDTRMVCNLPNIEITFYIVSLADSYCEIHLEFLVCVCVHGFNFL